MLSGADRSGSGRVFYVPGDGTLTTAENHPPPLDPEVLRAFRSIEPDSHYTRTIGLQASGIDRLRESARQKWPTDEELFSGGHVEHVDLVVPGRPGAPDVPLVVLRPRGQTEQLPCIYFIHGGGMIVGGSSRQELATAIQWSGQFQVAVVGLDYRLAPENPHPAPVEDCFAGLSWVAENAGTLKIDPDRILIAGLSAGGGLAAATTLLCRDRRGPPLTHQILCYPMLDDRQETVSSKFDGVVWDRTSNRTGWAALIGEAVGGPNVSQYAAPARATDLSGLPPSYLDVGSSEVFRDETMNYAMRLAESGVPVELHVWSGVMHGSESLAPDAEVTKAARAARESFLRRALANQSGSDRGQRTSFAG